MTNPANPRKVSTPHPDGFGGARDATILESYSGWKAGDEPIASVRVQAVERTKDLLKRAGYTRTRAGEFYEVRVMVDEHNCLQLA
jgi:hypothetical protein